MLTHMSWLAANESDTRAIQLPQQMMRHRLQERLLAFQSSQTRSSSSRSLQSVSGLTTKKPQLPSLPIAHVFNTSNSSGVLLYLYFWTTDARSCASAQGANDSSFHPTVLLFQISAKELRALVQVIRYNALACLIGLSRLGCHISALILC